MHIQYVFIYYNSYHIYMFYNLDKIYKLVQLINIISSFNNLRSTLKDSIIN